MFIRCTIPNGTHVWYRADKVVSVQKNAENLLQTIVCTSAEDARGMQIYSVMESQQDVVEAICVAMKTGVPTVVKENAQAESPPGRILS